ncbi:hypothetical protein BN1723_014728, partial [Verticillium longisporum]
MTSIGTGYDLSNSIFSPDGRNFQVEYAVKAVENGGTSLGIRANGGIVLAVEKVVTSKLWKPNANTRIATVDRHLGVVYSGMGQTRTSVKLSATTQSIGAERLGETAERLTHHAFEEFKHGAREIELAGASLDILGREFVRDHELCKITYNLGGGCDLDDVAEKVVGVLIGLLSLGPLGAEAKLLGLEHHVGELTTGDLVLVHLGIGASKVGLEGGVQETKLRPVGVKGANVGRVQARVQVATLKGGEDGVDARLRGHARQTVGGGINSIGTSLGASDHRGDTGTGRVVGVDVDGKVRVFLTDGTDKQSSRMGLENSSHILDAEDMNVKGNELVNKIKVVLQVVLLVGVLNE